MSASAGHCGRIVAGKWFRDAGIIRMMDGGLIEETILNFRARFLRGALVLVVLVCESVVVVGEVTIPHMKVSIHPIRRAGKWETFG